KSVTHCWASDHSRGPLGADFTIKPHCASQPTASWLVSGAVFPPLPAPAILDSLPSGQRRTSARGDRRVRPERHNPHSIATLRITLGQHLLRQLSQCPFCGSGSG